MSNVPGYSAVRLASVIKDDDDNDDDILDPMLSNLFNNIRIHAQLYYGTKNY